jgi:predicted GIY-YIG superfamily endonuclease
LTARKYKINLIKCLVDRIFKICSDEDQILIEIEQLKVNLSSNNYPSIIVNEVIDNFIKKYHKLNPKPSNDPEQITKFLSLPYINEKSEKVTQHMSKLVDKYFQKTKLVIAFKAPRELGHSFPFKDKVSESKSQSLVVYQINCKNCEASYIGKTERICNIRFEEHKKDANSALFRHKLETNHEIDFEEPKILDRASNDLKLQYKEMLYIRKLKPSLNTQENSELFTLIIRNAQLKTSITRDIGKYVKPSMKYRKIKH